MLPLDELEERGLTERRRNPSDRRHHALHLTDDGTRLMAQLGQIGAAHEDDICAPLNAAERAQLHGLLAQIAGHSGLAAGVHPGYRDGDRASGQRQPARLGHSRATGSEFIRSERSSSDVLIMVERLNCGT